MLEGSNDALGVSRMHGSGFLALHHIAMFLSGMGDGCVVFNCCYKMRGRISMLGKERRGPVPKLEARMEGRDVDFTKMGY